MKMIKMCLNWKVLAGLAAVGAGIFAAAPDLALSALPILLLAICPLSMLLMMVGMQGGGGEAGDERVAREAGGSREERVARLRQEQAILADRIAGLEQEEGSGPARNGKGR